MSKPNYAKPDGNQQAIIDELRAMGYDVDVMPMPNQYDLVVSGRKFVVSVGKNAVKAVCACRVEVKREGETLRPNQRNYWLRQRHSGNLVQATTAKDVDDWFTKTIKVGTAPRR